MWSRSQASCSPFPSASDLEAKGELANKAGLGHNWVGTAGSHFQRLFMVVRTGWVPYCAFEEGPGSTAQFKG